MAKDRASKNADKISQGSGDDTLEIRKTSEIEKGDVFKGGGGSDTIFLSDTNGRSFDLTAAAAGSGRGFLGYEIVRFNNATGNSTAIFNGEQFGTDKIDKSLTIIGDTGVQAFEIKKANAFSAANFNFTDWTLGIDTLRISGTKAADRITGSASTDTLMGLDGADTLSGGAGDDILNGGLGVDTLKGSDGDDILIASDNDALIDGGAHVLGDKARFAEAVLATNLLDAELVNIETIEITNTTSAASYDFSAQTEALTINGNSQADTIVGGSGADTITGAAGADSLSGGGGDDILIAADDDALIDGGANTVADTVRFGAAVLSTNLLDADLANVEIVEITNTTSAAQYNFSAQTEALIIRGSSQTDTIVGGSGADTITGAAGADSLTGGAGDDILIAAADDVLIDGGADTVSDTAQFSAAVSAAALLNTELVNVEIVNITNTTSAATYDFSVQTEVLTINGNSQTDTIVGGTAADTITGAAGADSLTGGAGDDILVAAQDDILIDGGAHTAGDTAQFGAAVSAAQLLDAELVNVETVEILNTTTAATYSFSVQSEALIIVGNTQNDTILGGTAADRITGGTGADVLTGGGGGDVFVYTTASDSGPVNGIDSITDVDFDSDQFDFTPTGTLTAATVTVAQNMSTADTIAEIDGLFDSGAGSAGTLFTGGANATALLVTMNDGELLVVDVNGDGNFTGADTVIDVTGQSGTFGAADLI